MDRRFVVRTKMDLAGCKAFWKALYPGTWILRRILWVFAAILTIPLWVWDPFRAGLLTVLLIVLILLELFRPRQMFKNATSNGNEDTEIVFEEDKIYLHGSHSEGTMTYAGFLKFKEDDRYYFLYIQKRTAYILPKKDFAEGDPEDFCEFLIDKNVKAA